jgi:hypothetical protein
MLCAYWCTFGKNYGHEENEKHMWGWLESPCACHQRNRRQPDEGEKLVVFIGDDDDAEVSAMRAALLSPSSSSAGSGAGYVEVGRLGCKDLLPAEDFKWQAAWAKAYTAMQQQQARQSRGSSSEVPNHAVNSPSQVVITYVFSDACAGFGSKPSIDEDEEEDVYDVLEYFDRLLLVMDTVRQRSSSSSSAESKHVQLMWLAPDYSAEERGGYGSSPTMRQLEYDLLRQYLTQRYVLQERGVAVMDRARLLRANPYPNPNPESDPKTQEGSRLAYQAGLLKAGVTAVLTASASIPGPEAGSLPLPPIPPQTPRKNVMSLLELCGPLLHSRKYDDRCMPRPRRLLPVLVTGLGGSGTHAIAQALAGRGVDMPHETMGKDGSVCWQYAVNDALLDMPYPHHARLGGYGWTGSSGTSDGSMLTPRFAEVVQVVRAPPRHISSFSSHLPMSYSFAHAAILSMLELDAHMQRAKAAGSLAALLLGAPVKKQGRGGAEQEDDEEEAALCIASVSVSLFTAREEQESSDCPRGGRCNLHFAMLTWLMWNRHVDAILVGERGDKGKDTPHRFLLGRIDKGKGKGGGEGEGKGEGEDSPASLSGIVDLVCKLLPKHGAKGCSSRKQLLKGITVPKRSVFHLQHAEYAKDDIVRTDRRVAGHIARLAVKYGF